MSDIGSRLRALRDIADISARELDGLAHLGAGHTSMIEAGRRANVTADTARALASALGCTVGWLLAEEGAPPSNGEIHAAVTQANKSRHARPVGADHTANDFTVTAPSAPVVRPIGELRVERDSFSQVG